jgi:sodium--glutamate symport carrier gltS
MELDPRETAILAIIVLFLGRILNKKIEFLRHYNIPEPVTGGVLASIIFSSVYFIFDTKIDFSLEQRDALLVVFFSCVGLSSRFSTLLQGGKTLLILLVVATTYLFIQNFTGVAVALSTGLDVQTGVLGGVCCSERRARHGNSMGTDICQRIWNRECDGNWYCLRNVRSGFGWCCRRPNCKFSHTTSQPGLRQ